MMSKATCNKCEVDILQVTADENEGLCMKCAKGDSIEDVAESMESGLRIALAVFFAFLFGVIGYAVGALIWVWLGYIIALIMAPIGLIYGFFVTEINFFLRGAIKILRLWLG